MGDIWKDANSKDFSKDVLLEYIKQKGKSIIDEPDPRRKETPLIWAIRSGRRANVQLLLDNGANVEKPVEGTGETPLYVAAGLSRGKQVVEELLKKRPEHLDTPVGPKNETPLMRAVTMGQDPEVVKLLVRDGASLEKKNADGKTAADLAAEISDPNLKKKIQDALKAVPDRGRGGVMSYFKDWAVYVLASLRIFQPVSSILESVTRLFYGVRQSQPPELTDFDDAPDKDPETAQDFKDQLKDGLVDNGLDRFYNKPGDTFLDDVSKKLVELKNDPSQYLKEPPELKDLGKLALYQPVIFCDDSASMRNDWPSNGEQRWPKQKALVERITKITNLAVPNKKGAYLRFINNPVAGEPMMGDEMSKLLTPEPSANNWTPIGSGLKKNVLKPLVYDVLERGELKKPLLVMMTTDGCPWCEEDAKDGNMDKISVEYDIFRNNIVECGDILNKYGYRRDAVTFCLNQIGSHPDATWFMGALDKESKLRPVLRLTGDRLDAKLDELQENQKVLEQWLLKTLMMPLDEAWAP